MAVSPLGAEARHDFVAYSGDAIGTDVDAEGRRPARRRAAVGGAVGGLETGARGIDSASRRCATPRVFAVTFEGPLLVGAAEDFACEGGGPVMCPTAIADGVGEAG